MKRWQIVLLVGLAIATIGGAGYMGVRIATPQQQVADTVAPVTVAVTEGDVRQTVTAPGELQWTETINLSMGAGGRIAEIHVRPGDWVTAGDALVELETVDLERAVTQAELSLSQAQVSLSQAQLKLEQLLEPPDEADVRRAGHAVDQAAGAIAAAQLDIAAVLNNTLLNETLEDAREVVEEMQHRYDVRLEWYKSGDEPDYWFVDEAQENLDDAKLNLARIEQPGNAQLQDARNAVLRAQQSHQEAEDALELLLEETDPLDVETAQGDIEAAQLGAKATELALVIALDNLDNATLAASADGVILDVNVSQGQIVGEGFDAIRMADPGAMELYATIIEEDYPVTKISQTVETFFDALPEHTALGRIARIVPEKIENERPLYAIYIELERVPSGLAEGMTADAEIIIDLREGVLRLPRSLVKARSDGSAEVSLWRNNREVERSVQTGLRGDVYIEILEGLQEGDLVVGR